MVFDTTPFQRSHGKAPRGRGYWCFSTSPDVDFHQHVDGRDYIFAIGAYQDAKRQARNWAKAAGHSTVFVNP